MTETAVNNDACTNCGAEVREGTSFCYACGTRIQSSAQSPADMPAGVPGTAIAETAAVAEVEDRPAAAPIQAKSAKRATAATERRKSRQIKKKTPKKLVWEQPSPATDRIFVLTAVIIFAIAMTVVALTVLIK